MFINWSPIRKLIWLKASGAIVPDLPWKTITGNPLSFIARTAHALKSCVVGIEPVQSGSGDPSPDNVRPISGFTGANVYVSNGNLLDISPAINSTFTDSIATALANFKSTGKYATGYTSNGTSLGNNNSYITTFTRIASGAEYVIKNTTSGSNLGMVCFLDDDGNVISHNTGWSNQAYIHTAASNEKYIMISVKDSEKGAVIIALGNTVPEYVAHNGATYSVTWNTEAGTVYGGTLDVTTGVLTVDRAMITPTSVGGSVYQTGGKYFPCVTGLQIGSTQNAICNVLPRTTQANFSSRICFFQGSTSLPFNPQGAGYASSSEAISAGNQFLADNNVQFVYPLATPVTYQLTAQQVSAIVGENNMWTDCATLTVEAKAMD